MKRIFLVLRLALLSIAFILASGCAQSETTTQQHQQQRTTTTPEPAAPAEPAAPPTVEEAVPTGAIAETSTASSIDSVAEQQAPEDD